MQWLVALLLKTYHDPLCATGLLAPVIAATVLPGSPVKQQHAVVRHHHMALGTRCKYTALHMAHYCMLAHRQISSFTSHLQIHPMELVAW